MTNLLVLQRLMAPAEIPGSSVLQRLVAPAGNPQDELASTSVLQRPMAPAGNPQNESIIVVVHTVQPHGPSWLRLCWLAIELLMMKVMAFDYWM